MLIEKQKGERGSFSPKLFPSFYHVFVFISTVVADGQMCDTPLALQNNQGSFCLNYSFL